MDTTEQVFRALADRTRLRILCLLRSGETCVGDLVQLLGVSQPTASRHLAALRRAGLVSVRRNGLWAFYSRLEPRNEFERCVLSSLDDRQRTVPELREDARRAAALRAGGGCCPAAGATEASSTEDGKGRCAGVSR